MAIEGGNGSPRHRFILRRVDAVHFLLARASTWGDRWRSPRADVTLAEFDRVFTPN